MTMRAILIAMLAASCAPAYADTIQRAAYIAAQEYVCDFPDFTASEAALAAVVAEGIPEDIAVEIIADLAWEIAGSVDAADFCGVMMAGGW